MQRSARDAIEVAAHADARRYQSFREISSSIRPGRACRRPHFGPVALSLTLTRAVVRRLAQVRALALRPRFGFDSLAASTSSPATDIVGRRESPWVHRPPRIHSVLSSSCDRRRVDRDLCAVPPIIEGRRVREVRVLLQRIRRWRPSSSSARCPHHAASFASQLRDSNAAANTRGRTSSRRRVGRIVSSGPREVLLSPNAPTAPGSARTPPHLVGSHRTTARKRSSGHCAVGPSRVSTRASNNCYTAVEPVARTTPYFSPVARRMHGNRQRALRDQERPSPSPYRPQACPKLRSRPPGSPARLVLRTVTTSSRAPRDRGVGDTNPTRSSHLHPEISARPLPCTR